MAIFPIQNHPCRICVCVHCFCMVMWNWAIWTRVCVSINARATFSEFCFSFICAHLHVPVSSCVHHRLWNVFYTHSPDTLRFYNIFEFCVSSLSWFFFVPFAPQNFRLPSSVFFYSCAYAKGNMQPHKLNESEIQWIRFFNSFVRLIYGSQFQWS